MCDIGVVIKNVLGCGGLKMSDTLYGKDWETIIKSCIFCETDFNEHGMLYGCELTNKICELVNSDSCKDFKKEKNKIGP